MSFFLEYFSFPDSSIDTNHSAGFCFMALLKHQIVPLHFPHYYVYKHYHSKILIVSDSIFLKTRTHRSVKIRKFRIVVNNEVIPSECKAQEAPRLRVVSHAVDLNISSQQPNKVVGGCEGGLIR